MVQAGSFFHRSIAHQVPLDRHTTNCVLLAVSFLFAGRSLTEFDADASGTIDFEEFRTAEKENRVFIQPAFDLQRTLRRKIEGSEFWIDATLRRHSKLGPSGINVMEYFTLIRDGKELPDIPIDDVRSIGIVTVGEDELECPGWV